MTMTPFDSKSTADMMLANLDPSDRTILVTGTSAFRRRTGSRARRSRHRGELAPSWGGQGHGPQPKPDIPPLSGSLYRSTLLQVAGARCSNISYVAR